MEVIHKIGRRKTAVARVYVSKGKGNIIVNKKNLNTYFPTRHQEHWEIHGYRATFGTWRPHD